MTDTDHIRTRPDGSIDTNYYMDRGRHMRSCQAHSMVRSNPNERRKTKTLIQRIFG